ncbi:hypothetical protein ABT026_03515 [Streptomyces sp. NPDC002734]|uniref:hypothetical protein n=1 Tax=Streptomyces sp. NPDC002734 TaxID=3154426 RepID=UPI003332DF3F
MTVACLTGTTMLASVGPASAHRHGCHARHSCPSDTGSYICGDLGDFSMCGTGSVGGTGGSGGTGSSAEPAEPVDIDAPSKPQVKRPRALPGGKVSVTVTAERGATLVVTVESDEGDEEEVAKATATGSPQPLTFTAGNGSGTYVVTATDAAGNESSRSESFTVEADGEKPVIAAFDVTTADPTTAAVEVSFEVDEKVDYVLAVAGSEEKATGEAGVGSPADEALWLPDGKYELTLTVEDAVGNVTRRTETFTVQLDALEPGLTQEDVSRSSTVPLTVTGPPKADVTARMGTQTEKVTLDRQGSAELSFDLSDGTYRPEVELVDRFGRRGTVTGDPVTVDTQAPALKAGYDEEAARYGDVAITISGEPGAEITLREGGEPVASGRLDQNRRSLRFTPDLRPGRHQLVVSAQDRAGNVRTHELTVTVEDDMTTAETVRAVLWAVSVLLVVGVGAVLLWRRRRRLIRWWARRREAARIAAELRAVARRQEQLLREQERYERDLAVWETEHERLAELDALARNLTGEVYPADQFRWGRRKKDERVLMVATAQLVEYRTKQGLASLEETHRGEVAVTDRRVLFVGLAKNREWDYGRWLTHEHRPQGITLIRVLNRLKSSGIAYPLSEARYVRLAIDVALAEHRGTRDQIIRRTRQELDAHTADRPVPPRAATDSQPLGQPIS